MAPESVPESTTTASTPPASGSPSSPPALDRPPTPQPSADRVANTTQQIYSRPSGSRPAVARPSVAPPVNAPTGPTFRPLTSPAGAAAPPAITSAAAPPPTAASTPRSPATVPTSPPPVTVHSSVSSSPVSSYGSSPQTEISAPPTRRSPALIAAAAFALGGLVGAGSFGLGQYFAEDGTAASNPVVNVAAPAIDSAESGSVAAVPIPNTSSLPAGVEPAADVARVLGPSVVQVETNRGQGSGVVYADGLILTNHHVIEGATQVQIRSNDGRVFEVDVLGSDPRNDIAVLSAPGSDLPVAPIGSSAALEPGQLTVAIGSPFQLQQTVTAGIVSSTNRPVPNVDGSVTAMIQTDAPINPGNSGGALANRSGELVGINASIRTDGLSNSNVGIGFAVPIDTAIEVAERIVNGESLEPGVLGVSGQRQDSGTGVPIAEVTPGSGAAAAGLRAGDRVLTIDGAPVTDIAELTGLVQSNFTGDTVELEVLRGDQQLNLTATLS